MVKTAILEAAIAAHSKDSFRLSPGGDSPYRTPLWSFVRHIKSHCDEGQQPEDVFEDVDQLIESFGGWGQIAGDLDIEEVYLEFLSNWRDVKYLLDEGILARAYRVAELRPLRHKRYDNNPRLAGYAELVSLAGWLQHDVGNSRIMLPIEHVAETLQKAPRTITRYRQQAVADEFLREIKKHVPNRLATLFRFDVDQFPELLN